MQGLVWFGGQCSNNHIPKAETAGTAFHSKCFFVPCLWRLLEGKRMSDKNNKPVTLCFRVGPWFTCIALNCLYLFIPRQKMVHLHSLPWYFNKVSLIFTEAVSISSRNMVTSCLIFWSLFHFSNNKSAGVSQLSGLGFQRDQIWCFGTSSPRCTHDGAPASLAWRKTGWDDSSVSPTWLWLSMVKQRWGYHSAESTSLFPRIQPTFLDVFSSIQLGRNQPSGFPLEYVFISSLIHLKHLYPTFQPYKGVPRWLTTNYELH